MTRQQVISMMLFVILGIVLGAAGISVVEKPIQFFIILFLAIGIEINAKVD